MNCNCNSNNKPNRVPIGNTIKLRWSITTHGVAEPLEGRDLTLIMTDPRGTASRLAFDIVGTNVLAFRVEGKGQRHIGTYKVELYENMNAEGQARVDEDAFTLVPRTRDAAAYTDGDLVADPIVQLEGGDIALSGSPYIVDGYWWLNGRNTGVRAEGVTPDIEMTAEADTKSLAEPVVTVTKGGTPDAPAFHLAFSGLKGADAEAVPSTDAQIDSLFYVQFGDDEFKRLCVEAFGGSVPGELTLEEADAVTEIPARFAFRNTSISKVDLRVFPNLTEIGSAAFGVIPGLDVSALTSIEIPNSVTSIGNETFSGCNGLTSINIPNSVTSIGRAAFNLCRNLTLMDFGNTRESIPDTVGPFPIPAIAPSIVVPDSLVEEWKAASGWKACADKIIGWTEYYSQQGQ